MTALADARILHLFANYKWTGPADPAIRTAARLRAIGLDVTFAQAGFVHRGGEHRMAEELWRRRLPVAAGLQLRKHFHVPSLLRDAASLRARLERDRVDLLHCHLQSDHLLAVLASRRLPRPPRIVRTLYDAEPPPRGWRERYCLRRTALVVAPSHAVAAGVRERFGVPEHRLLHQEPVTEPRDPTGPDLRDRWQLTARHRVVGITARIQPHRRFDLLWATARLVCDALPDARFVLLGRGNEQDTRELVAAEVERRGLQHHVVLPGYLREPEYSAALRSFDAFLFLVPGSDGTCRAVREAMAFALPVATTRRGMLPEIVAPVRDGEVPGVACEERPEALAAALLDWLRDDASRRRAAEAALRRARLDMDPDRAARELAARYAAVLERREAGHA